MDVPIKNYSSGMYMRLGFAISANLDPDILLLDEIFAVGDADFQGRCIGTVKRFMEEGKTIIFVSHSPLSIRSLCRRVCVLEQGEMVFDGGLEEGLAFYEGVLGGLAGRGDHPIPAVVPAAVAAAEDADGEGASHRLASGGHWSETGIWQIEFLRQQGLEPGHYVLDVGCGSLAAAVHLLPFLEENHYWGLERNGALIEAGVGIELPRAGVSLERGHFLINDTFDLTGIPQALDVAVASSVFAYLPFNSVARCIASVVRRLKPSGRFYATWFENPDPANFDPIVHPNGVTTYPDREPYHYPFELVAQVCRTVGATADRLDDSTHPRGESILVISRRPGPERLSTNRAPALR
jgi:SAM-dependent methyltransferase